MSLFAIDPETFELRRENGGFVRVSGLVEVQQGCHHRVNLLRGEARFATDKGVPHLPTVNSSVTIYDKGLPPGMIEAMFQGEIADVAGVENVEYVTMLQDEQSRIVRWAQIKYAANVSLAALRRSTRLEENVELRTQ